MVPRILVFDQDSVHRGVCCDALREAGFEPVVVWEASAWTAALSRESPLAVLVEPEPSPEGQRGMLEQARTLGIPCLAMSGVWSGPTNRALAMRWDGCTEFWEKPVPPAELRRWLARLFPEVRPAPPVRLPEPLRQEITRPNEAAEVAPPSLRVTQETASVMVSRAAADETPREGLVAAPAPAAPAGEHLRMPDLEARRPTPPGVAPAGSEGGVVPACLDVRSTPASGNLEDHAFATILAQLAYGRAVGQLMLQGTGGAKKLAYLQDGFVIGVRTSQADDLLVDSLVAQGLLQPGQRTAVEAHVRAQRSTPPQALVQLGWFTSDEVDLLVSTHIRNRLMDVFEWDAGAFSFREGPIPTAHMHDPLVSPMDFIWQGVRYSLPLATIQRHLAPVLSGVLHWATDPPSPEDMDLTQSQRSFFEEVERGSSLQTIEKAGRLTDAVWRVAYVLTACGFLGFRPGR